MNMLMKQLMVQWFAYRLACGPNCECAAETLRHLELLARLEQVKRRAQEQQRRNQMVAVAGRLSPAMAFIVESTLAQASIDSEVAEVTFKATSISSTGISMATVTIDPDGYSAESVSLEVSVDHEDVVHGDGFTMHPVDDWHIPGGHLDDGISTEAAMREALAEANLAIVGGGSLRDVGDQWERRMADLQANLPFADFGTRRSSSWAHSHLTERVAAMRSRNGRQRMPLNIMALEPSVESRRPPQRLLASPPATLRLTYQP
ncbi:MAG: hypothetical protein HY457_01720 [Parcubacteria group bacterium]|nr:hypothetical protein [Parcubacteria group bacterium]